MTYRVPNYAFRPNIIFREQEGKVTDIVRDPRRDAPLAEITYADRNVGHLVAMQGMSVGDSIAGLVMKLSDIKEGSQISNLETFPNSGPKMCRSPGTFATIVSKTHNECVVQLPSKQTKKLSIWCRAMVGIPAGEGRNEKPFMKAGAKYHLVQARGTYWPVTKGKAKNAVDHPYGGSGSGKRKRPVGRNTPPGAKVGSIAPSRTGKRR
jgi:large subunit ribosomal protein L2